MPEWARDARQRLQSDIAYLLRRIKALTCAEVTRISFDANSDNQWYLPTGVTVEFNLAKKLDADKSDDRITAMIRNTDMGLVLDINGSRVVNIFPRAANSIWIKLEDESQWRKRMPVSGGYKKSLKRRGARSS
jgi:hypothetical protein